MKILVVKRDFPASYENFAYQDVEETWLFEDDVEIAAIGEAVRLFKRQNPQKAIWEFLEDMGGQLTEFTDIIL